MRFAYWKEYRGLQRKAYVSVDEFAPSLFMQTLHMWLY